jgi:hypothetical protein
MINTLEMYWLEVTLSAKAFSGEKPFPATVMIPPDAPILEGDSKFIEPVILVLLC